MIDKQGNRGEKWDCLVPGTAVCRSASVPLGPLLEVVAASCLSGSPDCQVSRVTVDSRKVQPGSLFIALAGTASDGHDFIGDAVEAGCSALLVERGRLGQRSYEGADVSVFEVDDTRQAYGLLAEALFSCPAGEMTMLAVTGTNGKTTVSYLLESILNEAGKRPGILGTVNYRYRTASGEVRERPAPFTTPEPLLLQQTLREMADQGVDHVIMEVSSHGLEQKRIGGLNFDVAAFTNLSRDHLDYHVTMEDYFASKVLLFRKHLRGGGRGIVSFPAEDSGWSERLQEICEDENIDLLTCGAAGQCDISPLHVKKSLKRTEVHLRTPKGDCEFASPLVGDFNVANLQTAVAMGQAVGVSLSHISAALGRATGAPGRMQRIPARSGEESFRPAVFVDYAHTPDALQQVISTLAEFPHNRLYCIFGCGGDRDVGKRPLMGEVVGDSCDVAVVTNDNPRSEDPRVIIASILDGLKKTRCSEELGSLRDFELHGKTGFALIPDRHQAIADTIGAAGGEDIVLIAGKGHEQYQLTREGRRFFDDCLEAAEGLNRWNVQSLALATGGRILQDGSGKRHFSWVSTDSRIVTVDDVFVALKGERFDGHHYVDQVVSNGGTCLVVEEEVEVDSSVSVVLVEDTLKALGDLAAYKRAGMKEFQKPIVVGITGSSGKTTVKEMCAAIFRMRWPDREDRAEGRVLKTEGNFNNLIGLPLSLLPVTPRHKGVILEMGMNRPGEIEKLTKIADPDIACIINVHGAHLEGLGDIDGVARAKGELFQTCGKETLLVINSDDARIVNLAEECSQKKLFFGCTGEKLKKLDVWASIDDSGFHEETAFSLHVGENQARVVLQVPGVHNVSNALAAAAIGHAAGIDFPLIVKGLGAYLPASLRMQILGGPGGCRVINDTYNANPASMKAGVDTLSQLGRGCRVAILADMLELGADSEELHREIGSHVAAAGIDFLGVLGDFAPFLAAGAVESGMDESRVRVFKSQEECLAWLQRLLDEEIIEKGSYILVKGSRGMRLEKLVAGFIET